MLQRPGQHVELQAQLLSICHMAVCDATGRLAAPSSADASASRSGDGSREDGDHDEEEVEDGGPAAEALLTALRGLSRVVVLRLQRVCWGGRALGHGGGADAAAEIDAEAQSAELEATVDVLKLLLHVMQQVRSAHRWVHCCARLESLGVARQPSTPAPHGRLCGCSLADKVIGSSLESPMRASTYVCMSAQYGASQVAQPLVTATNGSAAQQPGSAWPALAAAIAAVLSDTAQHLPAEWLADSALRGAASEATATAVSLAAPQRAQRNGGEPVPVALGSRPAADRNHLVQVRATNTQTAQSLIVWIRMISGQLSYEMQ